MKASMFLTTIAYVLISSAVYADIEFSGAAYSETSMLNFDNSMRYGNRSAMRLKTASQTKGIKIVSEMEFYTLYGYLASSAYGTLGILIPEISDLIGNGLFFMDRLYMKFPIHSVDMTLGKQRIAWGNGMIFRPTDRFNRPNPLSISGRKEGINALSAIVYLGDLSSIEFVAAPADVYQKIGDEISLEHLKYGKYASRFLTNKFKSDLALSYQYDGIPKNHVFGLDMKGDIKVGYHVDAILIHNNDEFKDKSILERCQSVIGLDYSFWRKWIFLSEYLYNGFGLEEKTDLSSSGFMLLEDFKYRHYVYSQVLYQYDIFLNASLFALWNTVDKSLIISPSINYDLFQNTDLQVYSQLFFGDKTDEFGPDRLGVEQIYYVRMTVKF